MSRIFRGAYAALVTPMTKAQELDLPQLRGLVGALIDAGVHGLVPLGSTGEFYALSRDERRSVLRATMEAAAGRVPVVAGANAGSTREVVALCREAEGLGCAGLMLAAPYYSLPRPEELVAHFRAVNDGCGLPIMLYNYPGRTGVDLTPDLIERLLELPNIRYVKESTGEMARLTALIRRFGDRLGVFCGCDTLALPSFLVGAVGWVGGVVNVLPRSHARLYQLAVGQRDHDAARALFYQLLPTLELMEGGGKYTQWVKSACQLMGRPVGPVRQPLLPATPAELQRLREVLRECEEGSEGLAEATD